MHTLLWTFYLLIISETVNKVGGLSLSRMRRFVTSSGSQLPGTVPSLSLTSLAYTRS